MPHQGVIFQNRRPALIFPSRLRAPTEISSLTIVDELVCRTFRLHPTALHSSTRSRKNVAYARQMAMYLGHVCLSHTMAEVAKHYGRDRTTVAYACRVVEDRREQGDIELILNSLEGALETMMMMSSYDQGKTGGVNAQ